MANDSGLPDSGRRQDMAGSLERAPADRASAVEDDVLRSLGAAVIRQWNTLPTGLRRELFDRAVAMGDPSRSLERKTKFARFLHDHKNDAEATTGGAPSTDEPSQHAEAIARWDNEGGARPPRKRRSSAQAEETPHQARLRRIRDGTSTRSSRWTAGAHGQNNVSP